MHRNFFLENYQSGFLLRRQYYAVSTEDVGPDHSRPAGNQPGKQHTYPRRRALKDAPTPCGRKVIRTVPMITRAQRLSLAPSTKSRAGSCRHWKCGMFKNARQDVPQASNTNSTS